MCVIEFVGYTCGHTSLPVLRACPLTTASHTFPTCPRRGDKAFFAGEMCSACQRIIHSRATQIEEYEHRFMHERGVCGCETVFPYLIRPRVIGSCGGGGGGEDFCYEGHEQAVELEGSRPKNTSPNSVQLPPLLCEAMDDGGRAVVSVRLPSLYAAEWVADHRARHNEGLCHCNVDFRTYQEAMADGTMARYTTGREQPSSRTYSSIRHVSSMSAMSSLSLDENKANPRRLTRSSSHEDFSYFMTSSGDEVCRSDEAEEITPRKKEQVLTRPCPDEGPCRPFPPPQSGQPVRYSGAVFAKVPEYLKLMGPFMSQPSPYAHGEGQEATVDGSFDLGSVSLCGNEKEAKRHKNGWRAQNQPQPTLPPSGAAFRQARAQAARDYHAEQASTMTPLVGFPLGAGPEGVSHATPWRSRPRCWRRP